MNMTCRHRCASTSISMSAISDIQHRHLLFRYRRQICRSLEAWWLNGEAWWLNGEAWWLNYEALWLNGSAPDCCPAVSSSNPASPQPTADCLSTGGLPPGMALGRGLISVRGNRGKKLWKMDRWFAKKHIKEKKICVGLKNVIPISEVFRYRHQSSFRYPTLKKKKTSICRFEPMTLGKVF